ncbi:Uncharacterised protein [Chlamydia trachomatis]|nr:Uncharacterised protein [Chlamydia trachomatis]
MQDRKLDESLLVMRAKRLRLEGESFLIVHEFPNLHSGEWKGEDKVDREENGETQRSLSSSRISLQSNMKNDIFRGFVCAKERLKRNFLNLVQDMLFISMANSR